MTNREVKVYLPNEFLTGLKDLIVRQNADMWRLSQQQHRDNEKKLQAIIEDNEKLSELLANLEVAIKENKVEKVEVKNFPKPEKIEFPEIPEPLEEVSVKKPSWYEKFSDNRILKYIKEGFQFSSKQFSEALDKHTKKENAFAVRLVDKKGQSFYDAMFSAVAGGIGSGPITTQMQAYDGVAGVWKGLTGHVLDDEFALDVYNHDAMLHIPEGNITGRAAVNKFGRATAITTGNTWEIWDGNRAYVYPTSASITHIRAENDSAITRGVVCEIQGLDTNWDLVTQNATTDAANSETEVALTTALRRVFRVKVLDDTTMDEDIWVGPNPATAANSSAIVTAGNNQTLMAIYTVADGKTAYMTNYYCTANPGGGAPTTFNVALWARDNVNGYARQLKHIQGVAADVDAYGRMQHKFEPYYKFTERTDIYLTGAPTGASVDTSAGFDLILVDD